MAKYVDLPNLKENLTNFLNKKIDPIYAKKTEIPSNVSELNNDKSYQTAEEVGQAVTDGVARIVAGAPEDFDTLKEMSDWISSHETSAAAMNSAISDNSVAIANHTSNSDIHVTKEEKTKWDNKVDSIEGKTLSNNNFLYKYKDTLDKMPTTYQYKTHYNKEDGTFNMVSINAGSQGTDPQTFQKYTLPSNYKDIFDGVNSKIEDLALNGVYSNKANIDEVNSNLSALDNSKLKGYTVGYNVPANSGGWHKIAQITGGYFNFDLYATGGWTNQRKSNAHFQIQNINGTVRIVQLSGLADTGGGIRKIRMVRVVDDNDTWILEEHSSSSTTGEFFKFTIAGDVTVTPLDGSVDTTTDFKDSVSLDVSDIPTGAVITISSIDSHLSNLKYEEVAGGKNLATVEIPFISNNIIFTKKDDSTLIANGGNYHDGIGISKTFLAKAGITYTAQIITDLQLGLFIWNSDEKIVVTPTTHNKEITFSVTKDTNISIAIIDDSNVTFNNTEIKIQLEEGTQATEYEPYIPSVKMLAEENAQQNDSLTSLGKCKNLLKPTLQTTTQNGVTCTNNGDGTYTLNGTASSQTTFVFAQLKSSNLFKNGITYKFCGCPKLNNNIWFVIEKNENPYTTYVTDYGNGGTFTYTSNDDTINIFVRMNEGIVLNNVVLKPMLTTNLNATYDDFVPYTGDGETLTHDVAKLKNDLDTKANIADPVFTGSFSLNRAPGSPIGTNSHAEGEFPVASGNNSHAEGTGTEASGEGSHAEGEFTIASGKGSHAEGTGAIASSEGSHAEGHNAEASGEGSHAEGNNAVASGSYSHAEGVFTKASGEGSHAEGISTEASNFSSHSAGKYNVSMATGGSFNNTTGTAFVIGNGTRSTALSNAFSVQYDGTVKSKSTITASTTADYAEFFEWLDENPNNEDRVGYFVTLDGNRIKIASDNDDYILGIVSGEPFVLGNGDCDTWNGMYLHDEFRRTIYEPAPKVEEVEIKEEREETYIDEETGEEKTRTIEVVVGHEFKEVEGEFDGTRPKLNPDYDNTQPYVSRFDRKEWSPVGMLGVLAVRHDGTAKVNGYVTVNKDGIATACDRNIENSYRVIKANTDSVVEIIFK